MYNYASRLDEKMLTKILSNNKEGMLEFMAKTLNGLAIYDTEDFVRKFIIKRPVGDIYTAFEELVVVFADTVKSLGGTPEKNLNYLGFYIGEEVDDGNFFDIKLLFSFEAKDVLLKFQTEMSVHGDFWVTPEKYLFDYNLHSIESALEFRDYRSIDVISNEMMEFYRGVLDIYKKTRYNVREFKFHFRPEVELYVNL